MNISEKALYHQIHPFKLGTDIIAQVVSTYFLWEHQLVIGIIVMILPPIIASTVLIRLFDFSNIRDSAVGRYLKYNMTRSMEALRLFGTIPIVFGTWYHLPWLFVPGTISPGFLYLVS